MIGEFFYILKCAILSVLFIGILQIKVGNTTLETRVTSWFYHSPVPKHIQAAAVGGALAIENAFKFTKEGLGNLFSSDSKSSAASRSER